MIAALDDDSARRLACPPRIGAEGRLRWPVCVHEAGHAVVAHLVGAQVEEVSVSSFHGVDRVTLTDRGVSWEGQILYRVAARAALELAGLGLDACAIIGCRRDFDQAHQIAISVLGDEAQAVAKIRELSHEAAEILAAYARQLGSVATALSRRLYLTGPEFRELLAP